ncbi:MAG: Ykof family thiamine-binding protein [Deltaproteobacteria bacterium]|nr:Ykof family thiamine-binding protein [Deltaproteobacteria bacterium]
MPAKNANPPSGPSTRCGQPDLPWSGRGTRLGIFGCRFSLYPMTDRYAEVILSALAETDASKVFAQTDALSSLYRGKLVHVIDALRGLFARASRPGLHLVMEGQISKGCPGDSDGDSFLAEDDLPLNRPLIADLRLPVMAKIALYPLGAQNYIDLIAEVVRMAERAGLNPRTIHYATRLSGDLNRVMDFLEEISRFLEPRSNHYVLTFTVSAGSPTQEKA